MATSLFDDLEPHGLSAWLVAALKRSSGLCLVAVGVFLITTLFGFDANDPSFSTASNAAISNPAGSAGAILADILLQSLGYAAWLLPAAALAWGLRLGLAWPLPLLWLSIAALPLALMALAAFFAVRPAPEAWPYTVGLGGVLGDVQAAFLTETLPPALYFWLALATAVVLSITALGLRWVEGLWALGRLAHGSSWAGRRLGRAVGDATLASSRAARSGVARLRARGETAPYAPQPSIADGGALQTFLVRARGWFAGDAPSVEPAATGLRRRRTPPVVREPSTATIAAGDEATRRAPTLAEERLTPARPAPPREPPARARVLDDDLDDDGQEDANEAASPVRPAFGDFARPVLAMLSAPPKRRAAGESKEVLAQTSARLETVLDDFGVRGQITDVKQGPVITLHELEPAPGTRSQRVISLADDIARSLCALSVRVATVPGRNIIGVELPNEHRETVFLRELLEAPAFSATNARLPLALGKDISGGPIVVDLARMPHLLIAGTTGSGKSVAINAMILSLLFRHPPEDCRIIMIDPKVVELSVYEDIPHLLAPVVTEPHKAVVALKWVVRQMDERYRLMNHLGVRDIFTFNHRVAAARARGERLTRRVRTGFDPGSGQPIIEDQPIDMTPLPLIVVIVDEVADLMLTAGKEIENAIQRLSQKARAAGIHLIVATQRPSVDVLTGVIKANLPSRISFRVSSKIDSRTILGEPGAEQLLGQGDMLYMMPGDRILRIHGPLVTDDEVEAVVKHLRAQGEPDYVDEVTSEAGSDEGEAETATASAPDGGDDTYHQAVQVVARDGKASTSYLQRKLSIGYNTAAKLIERMEDDGLISRADHVGRRQVLMGRGGIDGTDRTDDD